MCVDSKEVLALTELYPEAKRILLDRALSRQKVLFDYRKQYIKEVANKLAQNNENNKNKAQAAGSGMMAMLKTMLVAKME